MVLCNKFLFYLSLFKETYHILIISFKVVRLLSYQVFFDQHFLIFGVLLKVGRVRLHCYKLLQAVFLVSLAFFFPCEFLEDKELQYHIIQIS